MKVLYIATYSGLSGATYSLIGLIQEMKTKGVSPFVIIPKNGPIEELLKENNIPYKKLRMFNWILERKKTKTLKDKLKWNIKSLFNICGERRIRRIIKTKKIDILHINAITASWGANSAYKLKIPIVWHIREFLEEDLNKKFRNKERALKKINKSNVVIAISDSVKEKYKDIIEPEKLVRIYNGVPIHEYEKLTNTIFIRDTVKLTLAGRIVEAKGHEEVVYAVKRLVDKGFNNFQVSFIGAISDKRFYKEIDKKIRDLNLENYIHFESYKSNMVKVWNETDIALVSSKAEAFGRVTVEAMMAGALVIGADTGGTKELLEEDKGLLYTQGDYIPLASAIEYAFTEKNKMKEMARKSQIHALDHYSARTNAENIYEVYKKCCK